jgi:hypothetical protein
MVAINRMKGKAPAKSKAKWTNSVAQRTVPVAVGTPLVLHETATKGLPKEVRAETTLQDGHGMWFYCVYTGMSSDTFAKVMLQGGKSRAVRAAAITLDRVADAGTVEACGPFVPYAESIGASQPSRQKRVREGELAAPIDRPDDQGPLFAYLLPMYDFSAQCNLDGVLPDIAARAHDPRGKMLVGFSEPPGAAGTVVVRFQDRSVSLAYSVASRYAVTDRDEAQAVFDEFYHRLRAVAPTQEPQRPPTQRLRRRAGTMSNAHHGLRTFRTQHGSLWQAHRHQDLP